MEITKQAHSLLNGITGPGFCVQNHQITAVTPAARKLSLQPGMDICPLLRNGAEEYATYSGGCLYVTLELDGQTIGAIVSREDEQDVFLLDAITDDSLRAMALAARELRDPLTSLMVAMDRLEPSNEAQHQQLGRMARSVQQLQRIIGNMSDAGRVPPLSRMEMGDASAFFAELLEKAQSLLEQNPLTLTYQGPDAPVFTRMDRDLLERAVWNLLSNAIKFTPAGGQIQATLSRQGRLLVFCVQDDGSGMDSRLNVDWFHRYQRQPQIEDGRYGLGLGMTLVRAAAAQHGGTVLIDHPDTVGTRVTMTLLLRQSAGDQLRSPRVDYAGEQDHALLELSEHLPAELYRKDK